MEQISGLAKTIPALIIILIVLAVIAPQALVLAVEPQANVSRYDGLREGHHAA